MADFNTSESNGFLWPVESMDSKAVKAFAVSVVAFVAIIGNSLVIVAVWKIPRMKTVTNYLIVNMAVADFLYIVVAMPPFYVEIFQLYDWCMSSYERGVYFCKVANFGQYLLVPVSVLTLSVIAADRFFAIIFPLKRILTKRIFKVVVPAIWIISAGLAAPILYAYRVNDYDGYFTCEEEWSPAFNDEYSSRVYSAMLFAIAYCVPFLVITIMYSVMCRHLWLRKVPGVRPRTKDRKAIESRKKVVKMLITVVIVFVVCWLPVQIITFLWDYLEISAPEEVLFFCSFLMRAHASMSPCIYAAFSENYRKGFKAALLSCCYGQKAYLSVTSNFAASTRRTLSVTASRSLQMRGILLEEKRD